MSRNRLVFLSLNLYSAVLPYSGGELSSNLSLQDLTVVTEKTLELIGRLVWNNPSMCYHS